MTDLVIVAIIIICVYIIPASATCALMHWITHRRDRDDDK